MLFVDNIQLDEYLQKLTTDNELVGLVPTLLDWAYREEERKIIWDRILPADGQTSICPILMCPDDLDFGCDIVVAEIKRDKELVYWNRFGEDNTLNRFLFPDKLGNTVNWFGNGRQLTFSLTDYRECLATFDNHFEIRNKTAPNKVYKTCRHS